MHYRINGIRLGIDEPVDKLAAAAARKLGIRASEITSCELRRMSLDARNKSDLHYVCTADVRTDAAFSAKSGRGGRKHGKPGQDIIIVDDAAEEAAKSIIGRSRYCDEAGIPDASYEGKRPVIVGFGPCGIFAALTLALCGMKPLVIERGPEMNDRVQAVELFRRNRLLNPEANMMYGEGGAGTFSDGKLATGIKDGYARDVLQAFADAGAGEDILYLAKPHIGTDVLRTVIVNLRHRIEELGGEIRFNTRLDALNIVEEGNPGAGDGPMRRLKSVTVTSNTGAGVSCERDMTETIETDALILAVGHSARDTFAMIHEAGLSMEQKPFSIGVRMEHPQELIDRAQYGDEYVDSILERKEQGLKILPPADYKINTVAGNGRGVYSFCMCPGGEVVTCSTAEGELCVNGMSNRRRDSGTANSGILCDVRTSDYNGGDETDVLAGVRYQEKYERLAYENGLKQALAIGVDEHAAKFCPPTCRMSDFLDGSAASVTGSLPDYAADAIREAVPVFGRRIRGYDSPDAVVTAVETRSSSPVRILRAEDGQSNVRGIYPAGEGAGYAGGITSAACDGIRAAEKLVNNSK